MQIDIELDDLLGESLDILKKEREQKQALKATKKGAVLPKTASWMTGPEVEAHYAEVKKIKDRGEGWKSLAAVLLIHSQVCSTCHCEHQRIEGTFIKKEQLRLRAVAYVAPKDNFEISQLPREVEIREQSVVMCPSCYPQQGWADIPVSIKE
jgi:hypothetical protein